MNLKDILLKKLDSILNAPLESKIVMIFLPLGAFTLGGIPFFTFLTSINIKNGDTTLIAEISNPTDLTGMILGFLFLVIGLYFYWQHKINKSSDLLTKGSIKNPTITSIENIFSRCVLAKKVLPYQNGKILILSSLSDRENSSINIPGASPSANAELTT